MKHGVYLENLSCRSSFDLKIRECEEKLNIWPASFGTQTRYWGQEMTGDALNNLLTAWMTAYAHGQLSMQADARSSQGLSKLSVEKHEASLCLSAIRSPSVRYWFSWQQPYWCHAFE